jgi:hypothetical protein
VTARHVTNPSTRRTGNQAIPAHRLRLHCRPCDKWAYPDKNSAKDERRALRRESKADGDKQPLSIYRCPENPAQWHIGHSSLRTEEIRLQYVAHGVAMGDR